MSSQQNDGHGPFTCSGVLALFNLCPLLAPSKDEASHLIATIDQESRVADDDTRVVDIQGPHVVPSNARTYQSSDVLNAAVVQETGGAGVILTESNNESSPVNAS